MPGNRRGEEEIRREIATERDDLADALADLRGGIYAKRRLAAVVGGALAAGLTALGVVKVARRLRDE